MESVTAGNFKWKNTFLGCSLEFERSGRSRQKQKSVPKISDEKRKQLETMLESRRKRETNVLSHQLSSPVTLGAKALAASKCQPLNRSSNSVSVTEGNSARNVLNNFTRNQLQGPIKPVLGKGYKQGDLIDLMKNDTKRKAIETLRSLKSTGLVKVDPNSTRKRLRLDEIIKKVDANVKAENIDVKNNETEAKRRREEAIEAIMSRKSRHESEVSQAEFEAEKKYFQAMAKKEFKEEKMREKTEVKCKVIICKDCRYTAHTVADVCIQNGHNYISSNAIKRFFKCKNCSQKTFTFNEIVPTIACRQCNDFSYEKTSMYNIREVKEEKLLIRGEEIPFLN